MSTRFNLKGDPTKGRNRLRDIALQYGAQKGVHTASILDRATTYEVQKIPTGIFMLDWYTGGVPLDRITRIGGPKDSYKSTTLYNIMYHAQNYCRYCKTPLVVDPDTGDKDCSCPNPRFKPADKTVIQFLDYEGIHAIVDGKMPKGVVKEKNKFFLSAGSSRKVEMIETYRCAPFQTLFVETEHKMDRTWAEANGVDTSLVIVIGCDWAEKLIDTVERLIYTGEVDILFVDTISMLNSKETIVKSMNDRETIAMKARVKQRFMEKVIAGQFANGLISDSNITVLLNSQVRTRGIGGFRTSLGVSDGNCVDHLIALDLYFRQKRFHFVHANYASEGEYEFTIKKNHVGGASGVSGSFRVWLDPCGDREVGESDDMSQVVKYGRQVGIIDDKGAGKEKYAFGKHKFRTLDVLRSFLEENRTIFNSLRHQVLQALKNVRIPLPKKEKE